MARISRAVVPGYPHHVIRALRSVAFFPMTKISVIFQLRPGLHVSFGKSQFEEGLWYLSFAIFYVAAEGPFFYKVGAIWWLVVNRFKSVKIINWEMLMLPHPLVESLCLFLALFSEDIKLKV